jgi:hypothetical protein
VAFRDLVNFLADNRRLWLPPVVLTVIVFVALILFGPGKHAVPFAYKIF